jgi:hypothetical protein
LGNGGIGVLDVTSIGKKAMNAVNEGNFNKLMLGL